MVRSREFIATGTDMASYTLLKKKNKDKLVKDGRSIHSISYYILEKIFSKHQLLFITELVSMPKLVVFGFLRSLASRVNSHRINKMRYN